MPVCNTRVFTILLALLTFTSSLHAVQILEPEPDERHWAFGLSSQIIDDTAIFYNDFRLYSYDLNTGNRNFHFVNNEYNTDGFVRVASHNNYTIATNSFDSNTIPTATIFNTHTGEVIKSLTPEIAPLFSTGGYALDVHNTTAIRGNYNDDEFGEGAGAAYIMDFSDPNNITEFKITPSDATQKTGFGRAVAIKDHYAVVSTKYSEVYIYNFADPDNIIETKINNTILTGGWFGRDIDISGDTAIVAAPHISGELGGVGLFDITTGDQIDELLLLSDSWEFGNNVAIHGNYALVTGPNDSLGRSTVQLIDLSTKTLLHTFNTEAGRIFHDFTLSDEHILLSSALNPHFALLDDDSKTFHYRLSEIIPEPTSLALLSLSSLVLLTRKRSN
ncbi:PEP-CTERM sorting domain-containing protein [Planctomycetota bacterium]|nr:PEP-CTERM sorting domain-containing protein [Planctomycetota bacterium]